MLASDAIATNCLCDDGGAMPFHGCDCLERVEIAGWNLYTTDRLAPTILCVIIRLSTTVLQPFLPRCVAEPYEPYGFGRIPSHGGFGAHMQR